MYLLTGGKLAGPPGRPALLLTTRGRLSGRRRTTPLLYLAEGDTLALVASFGGADVHPAWFLNLKANPDVEVRIGWKARQAMRAREATPEERERLWPRVVEAYRGYEKYQRKTERLIPLVILEFPGKAGKLEE